MIATALLAVSLLGAVPDGLDCDNPRTQLAMNQCAGMKAARADERLDALYRRYRGRLDPRQQEQLGEAQRAWLAFRTSWCAFIGSGVEGGSAHPMIVSECMAGLTEQRIKQLEQVSSCKEGDLSCPSP